MKLINKKDKIYIAGRGMAGRAIEKAFRKSHKKNLLKSSSTVEEILNSIKLIIHSKSMTGHVILLDGGAHLSPPRRDVGL